MVQSIFCSSGLLTQVSSLVCDDDGNVYASNFTSNATNIIKIDTNGNATQLTANNNGNVNYVGMVYVNGYIYVTGYNSNVYKVNIVGGEVTTFVTLPRDSTTGITYYNGSLYVVCQTSPTIYKVDMDGTYSIFISQNLFIPNYVTTDTDGNFYVTDNGSIRKYNNSGLFLKNFNNVYAPNGLISTIIYYNNYLYGTTLINTINTNYISKYDLNGNLITYYYATGGSNIFRGGITFDKNGNFYVSNFLSYGGPYTIQTIKNAESSSSTTPETIATTETITTTTTNDNTNFCKGCQTCTDNSTTNHSVEYKPLKTMRRSDNISQKMKQAVFIRRTQNTSITQTDAINFRFKNL